MDGNCGVSLIEPDEGVMELMEPDNWEEDGPAAVDGEGVVPKKAGAGGEPPVKSCGSACRLIDAWVDMVRVD
jgi:hypothetical protein